VNLVMCGFLHFEWELENFGKRVIPLVRERERELRNRTRAGAVTA
jgi:FMNH2-dependent dimethyl sulfone monooxygenase